jgi:hypothetical protein
MGHPGEDEFRIRVKGTLEEAAEIGSGGCPVETVIVIEDANAHELPGENLPSWPKRLANASGAASAGAVS